MTMTLLLFLGSRGAASSAPKSEVKGATSGSLLGALFLTTGVLITGCEVEAPEDNACTTENGYLEVCATFFDEPAEGHALVRSGSDDDVPLEALFDESGCTTIELEPGQHEWSAAALTDNCVSPYEQITIEGCAEVSEVSIELESWCLIGR